MLQEIRLDVRLCGPFSRVSDHIPKGLVMGRITASGLYGLHNPQAEDGREVPAGVLRDAVPVSVGRHASLDPATVRVTAVLVTPAIAVAAE